MYQNGSVDDFYTVASLNSSRVCPWDTISTPLPSGALILSVQTAVSSFAKNEHDLVSSFHLGPMIDSTGGNATMLDGNFSSGTLIQAQRLLK